MKNPFTPAVRRWIYGIAIAAVALAVQQGWIDNATALVIAPLVLAILNVSGGDGGDGGDFVTDSAGTWNADDIGDPTPAGE